MKIFPKKIKGKANTILVVLVLSLLCLFPNIFFAFYGSTLIDSVTKQIGFLVLSGVVFILPFLFFSLRTSFLIYSLFVLLSPIEVGYILLTRLNIHPGAVSLILQTNTAEAFELLSAYKFPLLLILFLDVLYFFLVFRLPKNRFLLGVKHRIFLGGVVSVVFLFLFLYGLRISAKIHTRNDEVWQNAKVIFGLKFNKIYPVDLVLAIQGAFRIQSDIESITDSLKSFTFHARQNQSYTKEKEIFVLIIGETARYGNFTINGYSRETTPGLSKLKNLISFANVYSGANSTQLSLPLILTRATPDNFGIQSREKTVVDAFKEAGFATYWIANQSSGDPFIRRIAANTNEYFFMSKDFDSEGNFDAMLLPYLKKILQKNEKKQFVVIHTLGSHFRYNMRYPDAFRKFTPDFRGAFDYAQIALENREKLINSYDNSILYTDYFLTQAIRTLSGAKSSVCMLYLSDHGENLFDIDKQVLHGGVEPTKYDVHIPMLVWTSPEYNKVHSDKIDAMIANRTKKISTSCVFYSLLNLAEISIEDVRKRKSIANKDLSNEPVRNVLNPNMKLIRMD